LLITYGTKEKALTVNRTTYSFSRLLEVALPLVSDMETGEVEMQGPKFRSFTEACGALWDTLHLLCEAANPSELVTNKSAATALTANRHVLERSPARL